MNAETISVPKVPESDLQVLRSIWTQSGYRGVYRNFRDQWVARVRVGGVVRGSGRRGRGPLINVSPDCANPRDAAKFLVRWYRETFGDSWAKLADRRRLRRPWMASRMPGYWRLDIWEHGQRRTVERQFDTEDAANEYAIELANKSLDMWRVLWRV